MKKKDFKSNVVPYIGLFLIMIGIIYIYNFKGRTVHEITYNELLGFIETGSVAEIEITPSNDGGVYDIEGKLEDYKEKETFVTSAPLSDEVIKAINLGYEKYEFKMTVNKDPNSSTILLLLVNVN